MDQRSDLYCVGLILYEMLAGRRAFDSLDWLTLLAKHALEPPPSLIGIPLTLETIVMKALQRSRKREFNQPQTSRACWRISS